MEIKLNNWVKVFLVFVCLVVSVVGFMIKLPSVFRGHDKELHAVFYFLAAAFLNILFTNGRFTVHILIFAILYFFSVGIEYAQEYSNKLLRKRIHGRYDPEDVKQNLKGLLAYSLLWITYRLGVFVYRRSTLKEASEEKR
ncbi:MAG: hypothetical protein ACTHMC_07320 [Pseudobacter sp.]|uniref:hypothetical protein n=1 Tax=Pseudobacter sp. TaxID=2045420 RepID=UPI003F7CFCC5